MRKPARSKGELFSVERLALTGVRAFAFGVDHAAVLIVGSASGRGSVINSSSSSYSVVGSLVTDHGTGGTRGIRGAIG